MKRKSNWMKGFVLEKPRDDLYISQNQAKRQLGEAIQKRSIKKAVVK